MVIGVGIAYDVDAPASGSRRLSPELSMLRLCTRLGLCGWGRRWLDSLRENGIGRVERTASSYENSEVANVAGVEHGGLEDDAEGEPILCFYRLFLTACVSLGFSDEISPPSLPRLRHLSPSRSLMASELTRRC